jgi:lysophospholipase L1-like esterase
MFGLGMGRMGVNGGAGAAAAVMPEGALGIWYASDYDAALRYVPNSIAAIADAPKGNLLRMPRRKFATGSPIFWSSNASPTITDRAGTAPDGTGDASRLVHAGGSQWFLFYAPGEVRPTVPAGTYTLSCYVKSNTGSDQDFMQFCGLATSTTHTATSTWQRFSITATLTEAQQYFIPICAPAGNPAADLLFCDATLHSGASDLGADTLVGHMLLGSSHWDTAAAYAAGEMDFSSSGAGVISFEDGQVLSEVTAICVGKRVASGGNGFASYLNDIQNWTQFGMMWNISSGPAMGWGGSFSDQLTQTGTTNAGNWDPVDAGYYFQATRYDLATSELFLNTAKVLTNSTVNGAATVRDLWSGMTGDFTYGSSHKWHAIALYDRKLTDDEIATAYAALKAHAAESSLTVGGQRLVIAEGDSLTSGGSTKSYPLVFGPNSNPAAFGIIKAVSGSTLASMTARVSAVDDLLENTTIDGVASFFIGTNSLYDYTGASDAAAAANFLTDLAAVCDARRALGKKVVVCTILPRTDAFITAPQLAAHEARRQIVNAAIVADWTGVHCDAVADFGGDALIGVEGASDDTTYYEADKLHLKAAGHVQAETLWRAAVNSV